MAFVSIREWTSDHVVDWLKGLDDAIIPYIPAFQNNDINGPRLLLITAEDLYNLNITKVGHQQLILEAVDLLRELNYSVDSENLQSISVKLGCKARSLYNHLKHGLKDGRNKDRVNTATLSAVSGILSTVKALVSWLDRSPFDSQDQYVPIRKTILRLSIELASTAQRDQFAENPQDVIRNSALNLADLCDRIVQEINDPLILQPAFIGVANVRKEENEELGIHVQSSYSGIHIVGGVKFQSPAHRCSKISEGDEILQVNYQTVVGWKFCKFVELLRDPVTEVVISLKKRPRHTHSTGQVVIMKPWRLPLKKKSPKRAVAKGSPVESTTSKNKQRKSKSNEKEKTPIQPENSQYIENIHFPQIIDYDERLKPRVTLKRRVTVSGASPTVTRPPVRIEELVNQANNNSNGKNNNTNKDVIQRSISHDPSKKSSEDRKSALSTSALPTIASHPEEADIKIPDKVAPIANLSNSNCSSQSTVISLRSQGIAVPHTEDEIAVGLEHKNILDDYHRKIDYAVSSDGRSVNADTGFVSLSESSDSTGDHSLHARSSPSLDTLSSSSGSSAFQSPTNIDFLKSKGISLDPSLSKTAYTPPSLQDFRQSDTQSYQVTIAGGVPCRIPNRNNEKSPVLRSKHRSKLVANRRISCKDLGQGDCQGWLYKKKIQKTILSPGKWSKRWFVLKNLNLYCYQDINDETAESLIYLPGFNVSPAPECKSKKFSFKAYHTGATFYFATESQQDLSKWMNKMGLAAISYDASSLITTSGFLKPEYNLSIDLYYSETEDEIEEPSQASPNNDPPYPKSKFNDIPKQNKGDSDQQQYVNMSSIKPNVRETKDYGLPDYSPSATQPRPDDPTESPYMNLSFLQKTKTERSPSVSSSTSTLNRPIPAKRGCNKSHLYMNIPPASPSYRETLPHPSGHSTWHKSTTSTPSPGATKASSMYNLNEKTISHTPPYMNLSDTLPQAPSQKTPLQGPPYSSLPDTNNQRSEFFGTKSISEHKPRYNGKMSSSSFHLDRSGLDTSSLTSSLDRKELRDISPGIVARLAGSYNRLDKTDQLENATNNVSEKLKRRELSPGRVARMTDSFDSLDRNKKPGHARKYSNSSVSSCSSCSSNRNKPMYQRSMSASHPAVSKLFDQEFVENDHLGSCENLHENGRVPAKHAGNVVASNGENIYRRNRISSTSSSNADCRRFVSVPEGAKEFIELYKAEESDKICESRHVSLVDREHRRLYGNSPSGGESNQNGSVPKSATSQQIAELYSKMRREKIRAYQSLGPKSKSLDTSQSDSSFEKKNGGTPKCLNIGENSVHKTTPSCIQMFTFPPSPKLEIPPQNGCPNMREEYVQSPGTVFTPLSSPPADFCAQNIDGSLDSSSLYNNSSNFIEMGCRDLATPPNKSNARKPSPLNLNHGDRYIPTTKSSLRQSPKIQAPSSGKMANAFEMCVDGSKGAQQFFASPRFSKKHLRAKSPMQEKKKFSKNRKSPQSQNSPKSPMMDEVLLPQRITSVDRSDSCSSLSSLNSTSTSTNSSLKHVADCRLTPIIPTSHPIENSTEEPPRSPGTPRTPVPIMGISVVMGKKRCLTPSSGESSLKSNSFKSSTPVSSTDTSLRCSPSHKQTEFFPESEDELINLADKVIKAKLTIDGVDIPRRRKKTMVQPCTNRRKSKRVLELRALERTLMSKKIDLQVLEDLLSSKISPEILEDWVQKYSHLLPSDFEDSD